MSWSNAAITCNKERRGALCLKGFGGTAHSCEDMTCLCLASKSISGEHDVSSDVTVNVLTGKRN